MTDDLRVRLAHIRNLHRDHALPCTHDERGLLLDEIDRLTAELERRPLLTCGASYVGGIGNGMGGPCTLRYNHGEPVHQDAAGARWWSTTSLAATTTKAPER